MPARPSFNIGGHRGVGENLWVEGSSANARTEAITPPIRENTLRSFVRAAELGVSFIEFDVQVTRDGTPVIWHDNRMVQKTDDGEDVAVEVRDMTLKEFKHAVALGTPTAAGGTCTRLARRFRGAASRDYLPGATLPWQPAQDDTLPTLAEVFASTPRHLGLNIEIKMSTPHDRRTDPAEVTRVVDAIWSVVREMRGGGGGGGAHQQQGGSPPPRTVFFSSFDPDIVEAMATRQSDCDVWFLSECGLEEHVDARRMSSSAAIEFATRLRLSGVVVPASVLLANERIVADAAAHGLRVQTYGLDNNDVDGVLRQHDLGVAGVIVDDVSGLMGALKGASPPAPATPLPLTSGPHPGLGAPLHLSEAILNDKLQRFSSSGSSDSEMSVGGASDDAMSVGGHSPGRA